MSLTFTNGMSYGDFDNDGDLDIVISNVNEESAVYENRAVQQRAIIILKSTWPVRKIICFGLGSIVKVKTGDITQISGADTYKGLSVECATGTIHFGLG